MAALAVVDTQAAVAGGRGVAAKTPENFIHFWLVTIKSVDCSNCGLWFLEFRHAGL